VALRTTLVHPTDDDEGRNSSVRSISEILPAIVALVIPVADFVGKYVFPLIMAKPKPVVCKTQLTTTCASSEIKS